jgi:hypothetical protein
MRTGVQAIARAAALEWHKELNRRRARAEALVDLGLPDPGFEFLTFEIMRFRGRLASMREVRT